METDCQGHMPDRICLLTFLFDRDGRANGLIFGEEYNQSRFTQHEVPRRRKQERFPQVYLMLSCSLALLLRWPIIKSTLAQQLWQ